MSAANNNLGRCTPKLVSYSLMGYFKPCLANDPELSAQVLGLNGVTAADALQIIASGRLPAVFGKPDEVKARVDEYAVQFVIDAPKILSARALVLSDHVAAEALTRSYAATARLIVNSVPLTESAEEMILCRKKPVSGLAVRITEKLTRPDADGLCHPHYHDHLIVHPHAYCDGMPRMIFRDPFIRASQLFTDLHQQGLKSLLDACGFGINTSADERAWELAFSISKPGERKRKVPFTVAEMRPQWLDMVQRMRLPELKPLKEPAKWPDPITPEMIRETAERHNWLLKPEHQATLESLGRRARTLHSFGHGIALKHESKAEALQVETIKTQSGIDMVLTVGGPKYGRLKRMADQLLASINIAAAAAEFAPKPETKKKAEAPATEPRRGRQAKSRGSIKEKLKLMARTRSAANIAYQRKDPLVVEQHAADQANEAIREILIRDGHIRGVLGPVETAHLSRAQPGTSLSEGDLCLFVGGFAAPINNLPESWWRLQPRKILCVKGRKILCAGTKDPVDANLLNFMPKRVLTLRQCDWLRLKQSYRGAEKQLAKGRLMRVRAIHGDTVETTGGEQVPTSILDWAFCTSEPSLGIGHLSHPISPLHREIGRWNPRIPPTTEQLDALTALGETPVMLPAEKETCQCAFLDLVENRCAGLKSDVRRLVLQYFTVFANLIPEIALKPNEESAQPAEAKTGIEAPKKIVDKNGGDHAETPIALGNTETTSAETVKSVSVRLSEEKPETAPVAPISVSPPTPSLALEAKPAKGSELKSVHTKSGGPSAFPSSSLERLFALDRGSEIPSENDAGLIDELRRHIVATNPGVFLKALLNRLDNRLVQPTPPPPPAHGPSI